MNTPLKPLPKTSLALLLLALGASLLSSHPVLAGGGGGAHIGGGGGTWTCREQDGSLRWIRMLDLDEGRREFFVDEPVKLPLGDEPEFSSRTTEQWLERAEQRMFDASPGFFSKYLFWKNHVLKSFKEVDNSHFTSTEDFLARSRPQVDPYCVGGVIPAKPEQLAIFNEEVHLLEINALLWNSPKLLPIDRAALYMHETIYYMLRHYANHEDSVKTRFLVAHLFSDMAVPIFAPLFSMDSLKPEGVWSPSMGFYKRVANDDEKWANVIFKSFDESTGLLELKQVSSTSGRFKQGNQFRCNRVITSQATAAKPEQYKYVCKMLSSTRWRTHIGRKDHELQISKGSIKWLKTLDSGKIRTTTYLHSELGAKDRFAEKR